VSPLFLTNLINRVACTSKVDQEISTFNGDTYIIAVLSNKSRTF
jgi:hypothetical protein